MESAIPKIPQKSVDLLFLDPPYNLSRKFGERGFDKLPREEYQRQFSAWIQLIRPLLKDTATVYICADWYTSGCVFDIINDAFSVRNRITWEREKGRGAKTNWKNSCEDIWFCTVSDTYTFHVERVKLRRAVLAPYVDESGSPKDWENCEKGKFRLTHPSNFWSDITVPFWSMPENTDHPTQKPEKLLAKLILASTEPGDLVFDPFCGSGTAAVTAKKLGRDFLGIERESRYALISQKRLQMADSNPSIQGYEDGIFRERNSK